MAAAPDLDGQLQSLVMRGRALELEGLPFPTDQVRSSVEQAIDSGDRARAEAALQRGESLYQKAATDWQWLRALLDRSDALRAIAERIGLDVDHLTARVGDARAQLKREPLSSGALEKAAASASLALAVLQDAVPKYCVAEAKNLGASIGEAERRGEDVRDATRVFQNLLGKLREGHAEATARALLEVRSAVLRIPKAPVIAEVPPDEEAEILDEARNLARRLHRIRGRARDAHSAARLMAQVRAALSEDRRYGSPEEEVEELWKEVDRLTREAQLTAPSGSEESALARDDASGPEEPVRLPSSRRSRQ
ncbi:MAG TPA: hypothetical protein VFF67_09635 [Thermoplasmata archaeon]|nr:hypothetical protein [Thermoplasmata archaeon]